jgi:EXLDI family protein
MPNRTIYVSQKDAPVFEQAQQLAGEALSSVIARALREYLARHQARDRDMKEVGVRVGPRGAEREKRFVAVNVGKWKGLSGDKAWWLEATVYRTQKRNWAIFLDYKGKTSVVTDPKAWVSSGDYLVNARHADLVVVAAPDELGENAPEGLKEYLRTLAARDEGPVDYLDI